MSDHDHPGPDDRSEDEAFGRLHDADPAANDTVDLFGLRREVDARIAGTPAATGTGRAAPARWLRVAAVAAAVAVVGSGAFVVGRQTGTGADDAATTAAATTTSAELSTGAPVAPAAVAPGIPRPSSEMGMGPAPAGAAGGAQSSASAKDSALVGWGGRTHFNDGGLSTDGGTAEAWGYDASQVVSAETAERIAAAVGVAGSAVVQYQAWTVGPVDGSGPTVSVMGDGMGSVSYNDPQAYPSCVPAGKAPADAAGSEGVDAPSDACTTAVPADISAEDAIARSSEMMGRIGLDPAAFAFSSPEDQSGSGFRTVLATTTLDGLATNGGQWSFSFVGDRLAGFYGGLAPVVSLGRYTVLSPAQAVARMNDTRFGVTPGAYPIDIMTSSEVATVPAQPDPNVVSVPAAPVPGAAIAWPVSEITLTGATLGLTSQYQADGSVLLLPAYTMTDDNGSSWTVLAVTDDQLAFTG